MSTRRKSEGIATQLLCLACLSLVASVMNGCNVTTPERLAQLSVTNTSGGADRDGDDYNETLEVGEEHETGVPGSATWHVAARPVVDVHGRGDDHQEEGHPANRQRAVGRPHPETYQEAVKAVVDIDGVIRSAFAEEDREAAHGPLHEIGHLLKSMNGLAARAELSGAQRQSVQIAVVKLFEAFAAIDATMHGEEGATYEEVSLQIEENLEVLTDTCTVPAG